MTKLNKWDKANMRNISDIERQIDEIFNTAAREAAALGASISSVNPDRLFSFNDYPQTKDRLNKMLQGLNKKLQASIVNGIRSSWTLSNNKNNELSRQVFGDNVGKLSQQEYRRYFSTNDDARKAFEERKTNGLKLSDRVWNYTTGFKDEIELGLDVSIRNGMSAADMTKELRQYLKYPDKLFRRVRDEHGNLQLSKAAAAFHPGQGVYRSSYKNARRLAATETNMAYRTSDHLRWQQADYVVGIRVVLSNNHTLLGRDGKPHWFTDICDELSAPLGFTPEEKRGLYPKDFKFVGWHPHCRCHALSVLKTPGEMQEDTKRILAGEETTSDSVNRVKDVPQEFKDWIAVNTERVKNQKSVPYFIRDNGKYVQQSLIDGFDTLHSEEDSFVLTDIREAVLKIIGKKSITEQNVKDIMTTFAESNDSLFVGGLKDVVITDAKDYRSFMSMTRWYYANGDCAFDMSKGNVLNISKKGRKMYNGETFNPFKEIKSALKAIRENRPLTFNEEYSLESLWHEIRHSSAVGWKDVRKVTPNRETAMETVNQFCARRTYDSFIKAIGGKAYNQKAIIENGYGYRLPVDHLGKIFKEYDIPENVAHAYLKDVIINTPYEDILENVTQFLISKGAQRTKAENLLESLRLKDWDFNKLIKDAK